MTQSVCMLGRQPALGLAELESLYGADKLQPLGLQAALLDVEPKDVALGRLGGTIKLARLLTTLNTTDWSKIEAYLQDTVLSHTPYLPQGKMSLGLSLYGLSAKPAQINTTALRIKKVIKASGRPVRVVPNKTPDLSSAQVLHNDLTGERGWELLFIRHGKQTYIAQTVAVQDINAYAARDQKRPKRDAKVGMLPPKLAQIIVNMAIGDRNPTDAYILDPFCGTGVILQEALLMGAFVMGYDLEQRMVDYTIENLHWLKDKFKYDGTTLDFNAGDATSCQWVNRFDTIACETYLGRPFSATPSPQVLQEVMRDVDVIHKKFLKNVSRQTKPGFRMCIAVPAWKTKTGFTHLKVLDNLGDLGYTRSVFAHADSKDLVYHRPEQIVARELVVLTRK